MSETRTTWFKPRHVVGLATIAAFTVLLQPVASQAVGTLMTLADGTTGVTAKVDSAGSLAVSTRSADRPVKVFDQSISTDKAPTRIDVAGYRGVQIYAYPYNAGITATPAADSLTVAVPLLDKAPSPSAGSVTLATWASGTPSAKVPGPAHELTRDVPQPAVVFSVSTGSMSAPDMYAWRVVVYAWK